MPERSDWKVIGPLGTGGQSTVYKVRTPARTKEREDSLVAIRKGLDQDHRAELAEAIWAYARPDLSNEVAALKDFDKVRREGAPAEDRLKREIIVLQQGRPGLPKLLDSNETEKWIVTEFFPDGTLEDKRKKFAGQVIPGIAAFKSLLVTVAALHKEKIVHRDIKPANVFIAADGSLVLGDFGIVYMPGESSRMTRDGERVGPWDYMPQWADTGERLETVEPNFDVYMLGKLLWCMISGRLRLPREYHREAEYDLTRMFPKAKTMKFVNSILDRCLCERPNACLSSAKELLTVVDETLTKIENDLPQLDETGKLRLRCVACGRGTYRPVVPSGAYGSLRLPQSDQHGVHVGQMLFRPFVCDVCTHYAFFAPGYPDDAEKNSLKQWKS